MKIVAAFVAVLFAPLTLVFAVTIAAGAGNSQHGPATATAAAVACTYAHPDPDRIVAAMEQLTTDPVDSDHWTSYAAQAGDGDVPFERSTRAEHHDVLTAAITTILTTTAPHAITTPIIVWWHHATPADDNDTSWQTDTVPGWDGTLDTYLQQFATTYATDPTVLAGSNPDTSCAPPVPPGNVCAQPDNDDAVLATIRTLESGGNYTESAHSQTAGAPASSGNPSGAYQYLTTTWNNYGGYHEAFQAPPDIQDNRARADITAILARFGTVDWIPIAWYVGTGGADNIRTGQWALTYTPNPAYSHITIGDYQTRWMAHYTTIALPATGTTPTICPAGNAAVIAWADTQIGAPYAAINPYRYGTPAWPGGTHTGIRGDTYTYPAGTTVYDCSGFVIAAWRQTGIDFPAQYGIYTSQQFDDLRLPDAPRDQLQPGDIAIYTPVNGVGHIVLIHHTDPNGTIHTIEATPNGGVHIGTLDWSRLTALKRPVGNSNGGVPSPG